MPLDCINWLGCEALLTPFIMVTATAAGRHHQNIISDTPVFGRSRSALTMCVEPRGEVVHGFQTRALSCSRLWCSYSLYIYIYVYLIYPMIGCGRIITVQPGMSIFICYHFELCFRRDRVGPAVSMEQNDLVSRLLLDIWMPLHTQAEFNSLSIPIRSKSLAVISSKNVGSPLISISHFRNRHFRGIYHVILSPSMMRTSKRTPVDHHGKGGHWTKS